MANLQRKVATRGFTLLEMLVVLLLMGLCIGLVSAVAQPDADAVLRAEADRLARLLELADDEARLTGKTIAWTADDAGYRFLERDLAGDWVRIHDNAMLRERTLPAGTELVLRIENAVVPGPQRLQFTPMATPLAYTVELSLGRSRLAVASSPVGEIRVLGDAGGAGDATASR